MIIHGGKPDYYDRARGYGIDPALHYIRTSSCVYHAELKAKLPAAALEGLGLNSTSRLGESQFRGLVGFCGRWYPCIEVLIGEQSDLAYSFESLRTLSPSYRQELAAAQKRKQRFGRRWRRRDDKKDFLNRQPSHHDAVFLELGAPVLLAFVKSGKLRIETNPNLKDLQFYKVVEPFTAFQEISMYLGNQLARQQDPENVPDKYRIEQHGFDPKWSFRKPPVR
jgi:hypothetical protein